MNNEPVAWMINGIIHECDPSDWAKEQYPDQDVIPLYTHPVKDLEDIDINITWNENSMRDFGKDELNFARAILRKAQK